MVELSDPLAFFSERANRKTPKKLKKLGPAAEKHITVTGRGSAFKHTRTGFRPDLDLVCRSGWEANVMRVLTSFNIPFEFEPYVFTFPVKRGTKGYTPDIYLTATGEWIEVKGYFDAKSRVKIKRFKKYYPEEFARLTLIIGNSAASQAVCEELEVPTVVLYPNISKAYRETIMNWEGR